MSHTLRMSCIYGIRSNYTVFRVDLNPAPLSFRFESYSILRYLLWPPLEKFEVPPSVSYSSIIPDNFHYLKGSTHDEESFQIKREELCRLFIRVMLEILAIKNFQKTTASQILVKKAIVRGITPWLRL